MNALRTAVLVGFVSSLFFTACGSDPAPGLEGSQGGTGGGGAGAGGTGGGGTGGEAGTGGAGGSGGTGGTAGTGGSGGGGPRCGDGTVDVDEACDDGNQLDGDGCSSACEWEGSCEAPIEWALVAEPDAEDPTRFSTGEIPHRDSGAPASARCGAGESTQVFRYVAPATGRLVAELDVLKGGLDGGTRLSLRTSCEDPSSVVWRSCQRIFGFVEKDVVEGEVVYFVADVTSARPETVVLLRSRIHPYRGQGEACGLASGAKFEFQAACAPGFTCSDRATPDVCTPNVAPVLSSARALRGGDVGDDLVLLWEAEDPNADWWLADFWLLDAEEQPIPLPPSGGGFDTEANQIYLQLGHLQASSQMRSSFVLKDAFQRNGNIDQVDVRMRDRGGLVSAVTAAQVETQPRVSEGEPCDPERLESLCDDDELACKELAPGAPTCESRVPDRTLACADAPLVEMGSEVSIPWDREDFVRPADWPFARACFAAAVDKNGRFDRPEMVFRLRLDEARTNVRLLSGDFTFNAIALYEGCGLGGAPLACDGQRSSKLEFDELAAGDYLVVLSLPARTAGTAKLLVEADPLPEAEPE